MATRNRYAHPLAIFLAAILAWPNFVPFPAPCPIPTARVEVKSRIVTGGAAFQGRERKGLLDQPSWSDLADNFEGTDGRDDLGYSLPAIGHPRIDLPSLIPSALEILLHPLVHRSHPFLLALHLRC